MLEVDTFGRNDAEKAYDDIVDVLQSDSRGFSTFQSLLTPQWQSPKELADAWIRRVASKQYKALLQANSDKDLEIQRWTLERQILSIVAHNIYSFSQKPSFWQRLSSSTKAMYLHDLPGHIEDRVMAKEIWFSTHDWKSVQWLLAYNPELSDLIAQHDTIFAPAIDEDGSHIHSMNLYNADHLKVLDIQESIPGIESMQIIPSLGTDDDAAENNIGSISTIILRAGVLERYRSITGIGNDALISQTRALLREKVEKIPVWCHS